MFEILALLLAIFVMAILYSSVGHGGASGYLAAMAIFSLAPEFMKPAALMMNIAVSSLLIMRFHRSGILNGRLINPLVIFAIPFAYLGGGMHITAAWYYILVGITLMFAALWMLFKPCDQRVLTQSPPLPAMLFAGSGLGFLSGLTGVGGGIFLSPLLLLMRWADMRTSAGVAAVFIWVNSIAGILGYLNQGNVWQEPKWTLALIGLVVIGGYLGSELNLRSINENILRRLLGGVLIIASLKMFAMAM